MSWSRMLVACIRVLFVLTYNLCHLCMLLFLLLGMFLVVTLFCFLRLCCLPVRWILLVISYYTYCLVFSIAFLYSYLGFPGIFSFFLVSFSCIVFIGLIAWPECICRLLRLVLVGVPVVIIVLSYFFHVIIVFLMSISNGLWLVLIYYLGLEVYLVMLRICLGRWHCIYFVIWGY